MTRAILISILLCATAPCALAAPADPPPATSPATPPGEEVEPPPAPLRVEPEEPAKPVEKTADTIAAPSARQLTPPTSAAERPYRIGAWTGVGLTLAFVTSGIVLGVLAQRDSDAIVRLASEREDGKPLPYDAERQERYTHLSKEGTSLNRAAVACFIVAGISAVTSGLLFWDASRRAAEQKKSLALVPAISMENREARLLLSGRF